MNIYRFICIGILCLLFAGSCRKEDNITDDPKAMLSFSRDKIEFDTVFTTLGSATRSFKVKNRNKNAVKISSIRLARGLLSSYRINVDGQPGIEIKDKELAGGDSMYVFVEVTIDPNNISTPFIVTDSIVFETNTNIQDVKLVAFGQNAHFYKQGTYLDCNATWTNDMPYVIYNGIGVAPGCTLTIKEGVKVYSHRGSFFYIRGTLIVEGTKDNPVIFRGDRLEASFKELPGQWSGLRYTLESSNNILNNAIIENADFGIFTGPDSLDDPLILTNKFTNISIKQSIIRNMSVYGIIGYKSEIDAENLLVYNSGKFLAACALGGKYNFNHCTFANGLDGNFPITRREKEPAIALERTILQDQQGTRYPFDAIVSIKNSIIWGSEEDEVSIAGEFTVGNSDTSFSNNIIKSKKIKFGASNRINQDPKFTASYKSDYNIMTSSPAKDLGLPGLSIDLLGRTRDGNPDAGCYEAQ